MKFGQSLLVLLASALVNADCELSSDGNYYCSVTKKVTYQGVGYSGTYDDITAMNDDGSCSSKSFSFSGNLSPLDEELSIHVRGPVQLKQFGVYFPSSSNSKKIKRDQQPIDEEDCATTLVHKHHLHKRATKVVEVTQTVYVDANGETQTVAQTSTVDNTPANTNSPVNLAVAGTTTSSTVAQGTTSSSTAVAAASSSSSSSDGSSSDWTRSSYYTPGSADNLVFLNYYGGSGSGVWSSAFGNSLSYANSDMTGGSSSSQVLSDVTIPSNTEFVIMSGNKCSGDDCDYYRPGIPAYHGFGGDEKIFVFEFEMPTASGDKTSINYDMPAIWALNAKIPRTLQYGNSECSCWPACGELDLFEILSSGSDKLISHLHSDQTSANKKRSGGGGSQDYFQRPTSGSMKAAVIFNGDAISIVQVDDSTDFGSGLSQSTVDGWLSESGSEATIGY